MRKVIGRYGISGKAQTSPIKQLFDGQKCRVVFAWLLAGSTCCCLMKSLLIIWTLETIDALPMLSMALSGVVLVSHDFRLIDRVAKEIGDFVRSRQ